MNRNRVSAVILFWLAACLAMLAASSCRRRETPVSERPAETARKAPSSPVATPQAKSVPPQAKPAVRALAEIPATTSATQKRRAVEHPAAVMYPATITIGGFPVADNGKTLRVMCDGAKTQCVVAAGNCVALLNLVPDVPHSCAWGYDEQGRGGVAFATGTVVIR